MAKAHRPRDGNLTLVLSSLLIAFFIWLIAKQGETEEADLVIQVRKVSEDPICETVCSPDTMEIRVQYPKSLYSYVTNESFRVDLDVSDAHLYAGIDEFKNNPITITLEDVVPRNELPAGIRPIRFMSSNKATLSAKLVNRRVTVQVPARGAPAQGYQVSGAPAAEDADGLRLVGPRAALDKQARGAEPIVLKTEPVDLDGLDKAVRVYRKALVPPGFSLADTTKGRLLEEEEWRLLVSVPIEEETVEQQVGNIKIAIRPFTDGIRLEYSPQIAQVKVRGYRSLLWALKPASFEIAPAAPLNETPGFTGQMTVSAAFSSKVPDKVRDGVEILGVAPGSIQMNVIADPLAKARR